MSTHSSTGAPAPAVLVLEDGRTFAGTAYDDELGDQVRVTVVATGLSRHGQQRRTAPPLQVLRTGNERANAAADFAS